MQLALVRSEPLMGVSAAALPSGRAGAGARGRWRAREAARTALVSSLGTSASAMLFFRGRPAGRRRRLKGEKDGTKYECVQLLTSKYIPVGFALIQCCPPPLPPCPPPSLYPPRP